MKTMRKGSYAWVTLLLLVALVAAACGGQASEPTAEEPAEPAEEEAMEEEAMEEEAMEEESMEEEAAEVPELPDIGTITIGYVPILGFAHFMVADGMGYFADQGLDVELVSFVTGGEMIAPLTTGDLDVGGGQTGPGTYNAINQGLDLAVVGPGSSQPEGHGAVPLLVRTDLLESGEVTEVGDLAGKKIAVNTLRGVTEWLVSEALADANLTVDDVELVALPFPEHPAALANAAVDASVLPHPLAGVATRPGENGEPPPSGVLLEGDQLTDDPQVGVIYFGERLLRPENHEVGVRILVAILMAIRDMQDPDWQSNDDIVNAILTYSSVPEPAVRNGVPFYFQPNGVINLDSLADQQNYHFNRGYTDLEAPLDLEQMVDRSYLEEALARIGEYEG